MPTVRKTSILPASPQASESSSRCKVCSLPPDIRQELVDLRTEKGFSFYDLVEHFNSALPNRIRGGLLPDDTTEISMSGLSRHFQKHVSVDPDALYPMARERQVNLLLQSLHDRATLFQRMHDHLRSLLELATRKSAEWSRLLESEADLREEYHRTAQDRLERWTQLRDAHEREVREYEDAFDVWKELGGDKKPVPPGGEKHRIMKELLQVPEIPGLAKEEERILKLVREIREQMAEMSKVLSYEDGYTAYLNIELETLLQHFAEDSYQVVEAFGVKTRNMVFPDKLGAFFSHVREMLQEQNARYRERYRTFFMSVRKFSSEMKGK